MDIGKIINDIEQNLFLPKSLIAIHPHFPNASPQDCSYEIKFDIIDDCSIASCGCCFSNSLFRTISHEVNSKEIKCPSCDTQNVHLIGPVKPLRNLYHQLIYFKSQLSNYSSSSPPETITSRDSIEHTGRSSSSLHSSSDDETLERNKTTLIGLFHSIASSIDSEEDNNNSNTPTLICNKTAEPRPYEKANYQPVNETESLGRIDDLKMLDNISNTRTLSISQDNKSSSNSVSIATHDQRTITGTVTSTAQNKTSNDNSISTITMDEKKEYYFAKCFPSYRKKLQYNTHSKFLRTKSKVFINNSISPDCSKFALITEHKWEVYSINGNSAPTLLFCGKSNGEFGPSFDTLTLPADKSVLYPTKGKRITNWEHLYCRLSNDFLVISGSKNVFRVYSLHKEGEPIYTYKSSFAIRCIDIDPNSKLIACSILGKDRNTGSEQALIVFHRIEENKVTLEPNFLSPMTIILPYRDPINTLQISNDAQYLSCSTALESRFLIISLKKINEPRLIMKSLRSIDTSQESEGITDTKLFPGNPNIMCVTSSAFNSPPIVINTKIENIDGIRSVAQPSICLLYTSRCV